MIDRWHLALGGIAGYAPAVARFDSAAGKSVDPSLLGSCGADAWFPLLSPLQPLSALPRQAAAGFEPRHGDQRRPKNENSPTRRRRCDSEWGKRCGGFGRRPPQEEVKHGDRDRATDGHRSALGCDTFGGAIRVLKVELKAG